MAKFPPETQTTQINPKVPQKYPKLPPKATLNYPQSTQIN